MIELISYEVKMPKLENRRFQICPKTSSGKKQTVTDTVQGRIIYTGNFENVSLITYNLNKKYYKS